jgi:uncharacterized surface protein with fasciclin (FAS1) repeats
MKRSSLQTTRSRLLGGAVLGGLLAVGAAACGGGTAPTAAAPTTTPATTHPATMEDIVGPECSMVPASGMGSLHSMAMEPVLTAASHSPLLRTWAAEVRAAGLEMTVADLHGITVFVPTSEAFSMAAAGTTTMMHDMAELRKILEYTVVKGRVTPAELAHGMALVTLEGSSLQPAKMGSVYEVGSAEVLCGNIPTSNATVYVISKVLSPRH